METPTFFAEISPVDFHVFEMISTRRGLNIRQLCSRQMNANDKYIYINITYVMLSYLAGGLEHNFHDFP